MIQSNYEQILDAQKNQMKGTISACQIFIDCITQVQNMQYHLMKSWLSDVDQRSRNITDVKDVQDLTSVSNSALQSSVEKTASCAKDCYSTMREAHVQMTSVIEEQISTFSRSCAQFLDSMSKNAPSGSEAFLTIGKQMVSAASNACNSINRVTKQCMELAESNFHAATQATAKMASAGSAATDRTSSCCDSDAAPATPPPPVGPSAVHHKKPK